MRAHARLTLPPELQEATRGKASLLRKGDWYAAGREVERTVLAGSGKILHRRFQEAQALHPVTPETAQRKRAAGRSERPLVDAKWRLLKAVTDPKSNFRAREAYIRRRDGVFVLKVGFNPRRFPKTAKGSPITVVLQRGRLQGVTLKRKGGTEFLSPKRLMAFNAQRKRTGSKKDWSGSRRHATAGWPILVVRSSDSPVIAPVLHKVLGERLRARLGAKQKK